MILLYTYLLQSLKVSRNLPLIYRYSMSQYGALGLPNLLIEQAISRLSFLMMHVAADTLPGQHIRHSIELLQLEVGMGSHFFQLPYSKYGSYTTPCWLSKLLQHIFNITITTECRKPHFF